MLLQGEVARVEERPESTALSARKSGVPGFTEDEGDDLEEQLRDVDGLRTEVEDLSRMVVERSAGAPRDRERMKASTHLTKNSGEAGESDTKEVHSEGVNDHVGVVFEGHASSRNIFGSLRDVRGQSQKIVRL